MNRLIIQVEGLIVFMACLYFFALKDFSWGMFFLLLFAPDVSMIGYVAGSKSGQRSIIYFTPMSYRYSSL